jgi:threonine/homoserine/homoserine lactone efflux protein
MIQYAFGDINATNTIEINVTCNVMNNYFEAIISGLLLGLFIAISVGPTLFAVINYSMHHSYRAGIAFVLGVSLSDVSYVVLANIATTWLQKLEDHKWTIGIIGSLLFIGIGLYGFFKKYKPRRPKPAKEVTISRSAYAKIFASGFLMNALNPAVIIIWMGAAVKVSVYSVIDKFLFFGVCLGIVLSIDFSKVFLADRIRNWLTLRKIMYFNKISALCILAFGVILFFSMLLHVGMKH